MRIQSSLFALLAMLAIALSSGNAAAQEAPRQSQTYKRNSPVLLTSGIVLTAAGGGTLLMSFFGYSINSATCEDDQACKDKAQRTWIPILVGAGAVTATGIVMIVIGGRQVPADSSEAKLRAPPARPALLLGPTGAAVRWEL